MIDTKQQEFNQQLNDWAAGWIGQIILVCLAVSFPWVSVPLITIYYLIVSKGFRRFVGWASLVIALTIAGICAWKYYESQNRFDPAKHGAIPWDPTEFKRADERPPVAVWDPAKDGFKCVANC